MDTTQGREDERKKIIRRIRIYQMIFLAGLAVSFSAVVFVEPQLRWLCDHFGPGSWVAGVFPALADWLDHLRINITESYERYPVIPYCMDYLAFAHIAIGVLFWGVVRDPVRNRWLATGLIVVCGLMIPFALWVGWRREVPWFWTVVDSSFAVAGGVLLGMLDRDIRQLERTGRDG